MAGQDSGIDLKKLARLGAAARIVELEREIAALQRAFPELRTKATDGQAAPAAVKEPGKRVVSKRGRRKPMSATERKAVSERMKKFWAERRKQKD